jgi:hypothetical protein
MGDVSTAIVGKVVGTIPIVGNIASALLAIFGGSLFDDPEAQIRQWESQMVRQQQLEAAYRKANPRAYARQQVSNYLRAKRAVSARR